MQIRFALWIWISDLHGGFLVATSQCLHIVAHIDANLVWRTSCTYFITNSESTQFLQIATNYYYCWPNSTHTHLDHGRDKISSMKLLINRFPTLRNDSKTWKLSFMLVAEKRKRMSDALNRIADESATSKTKQITHNTVSEWSQFMCIVRLYADDA